MEQEQIVLRAFKPKNQMPIKLRPLEDRTGKLYTGQGEMGFFEFLTEEERSKLTYIIDHNTTVLVKEGKVLDMRDPIDRANWKWMQRHPYIALDRFAPKTNRDAVFYVDNPQKEAEDKVKIDRQVSIAKATMYGLPTGKKTAIAEALGNQGANSMSVERIEEWLSMKIEKSPESILTLMSDDSNSKLSAMALFEKGKAQRIITQHAGSWRIGGREGVPMGNNLDEAVSFILDKANEEQIFLLQNMIQDKISEAVPR